MDDLDGASWIKDPFGRYLAVGKGLSEYLGVSRDAMRGRNQRDFWSPTDANQFEVDDRRALAWRRGVVVPEVADSRRWVVTIKVPLFRADGALAGTFGLFVNEAPERWRIRAKMLYRHVLGALGDAWRTYGIDGHNGGLLPHLHWQPPLGAPDVPPWLEQVRLCLLGDFRRNWTIMNIAREVGIHPGHVGRAFRKAHGSTIHAYIARLRVEWACVELLTTTRLAGEIGFAAGFADQSHFTRVFRRLTSTTPGEYRRARTVVTPPGPPGVEH